MGKAMRAALEPWRGPGPESGLRLLIERLPALAWATDRDLRVLWMIGAGFASLDPASLVGLNLRHALRESDNPNEAITAHKEALAGRASRYESGMHGLFADVHVEPFRDGQGGIVGALGIALDITERKRAEEVVHKRERQLLDAQRVGQVRLWEEDFRTVLVANDLATLLGEPPVPNLPRPREESWKMIHSGDLPRLMELRRRLLEDGGPFETEYRMVGPDGIERVVLARGELLRDAEGKPERILGTAVDITDRKRAEEALHRSEGQLLEAQRLAHFGSWERDARSDAVELSEEARRMFFGNAPGTARTYQEFLACVHPDDRERVRQLRDVYLASTAPADIEYRIVHPDGTERWIHGRVQVLRDAGGEPARVIGTNLDITDRKRAADELRKTERLLLDAEALGHVGTWEQDFVSGEVYSSEENRRLFFGGDRTKGKNNDDYWTAIHPADRERVLRQHEELMAGSGSPSIEFRVVWPDGSVHWIHGYKQIVRDASGKPVRQYGTNVDITERKLAADEVDLRVRQQAAVAELGLSALRGVGLQALFEQALTAISRACAVDFAEVMELLPDGTLLMRAGFGWRPGVVGSVLPAAGSQCGFAIRSGGAVVVADLSQEQRFTVHPLLLDHGLVSGVTALMQGRDRAWGTLGVHAKDQRTWSQHDLNFVQSIANVLATALEREHSGEELAEKREQLQSLSRKLIEAQEAERRAVARELHDDFGQALTAIRLNLKKGGSDLSESIQLVDQAIQRMRELAQDLRPSILDDLGLPAALRWYVAREAKRAGLELRLEVADLPRLPAAVETTCFRLVQEALTNIVRHAQARKLEIEVAAREGSLLLTVRDDGKGFDPRAALRRAAQGHSLGLLGMKERVSLAGGELEIESAPVRGTVVSARFPLPGGQDDASNAARR
jgi:signal transduction histidine kinase/PAS domain-containing protein